MQAKSFDPVRIGRSPAGTLWTARKPQDVAIMRDRLAALWARHTAKTGEDRPAWTL